jgi:hypothetical protein
MGFFGGTPGQWFQKSKLGPEQMGSYNQLQGAAQGMGAGGAFGDSADYYRGLLSNNSEDFNAFANPELRRFREQTIPGISEQFAGMGSGGLSSSGFRNATVNAGTDLSERLGAIRAQLRQQGAQGLMGIGQQSLGDYNQNFYSPPQDSGMLGSIGSALGGLAGSFFPGVGTALGAAAGGALSNVFKRKQQSYAYDNGIDP